MPVCFLFIISFTISNSRSPQNAGRSHLAKLGTSDNIEPRSTLAELAAEFSFSKIGRAPARFDETDLENLNAALVHAMPFAEAQARLKAVDPRAENEAFWLAVRENCARVSDAGNWVEMIFGKAEAVIADEDQEFIAGAGALYLDDISTQVGQGLGAPGAGEYA
jgi:glutamyl-tRNA synthetase